MSVSGIHSFLSKSNLETVLNESIKSISTKEGSKVNQHDTYNFKLCICVEASLLFLHFYVSNNHIKNINYFHNSEWRQCSRGTSFLTNRNVFRKNNPSDLQSCSTQVQSNASGLRH